MVCPGRQNRWYPNPIEACDRDSNSNTHLNPDTEAEAADHHTPIIPPAYPHHEVEAAEVRTKLELKMEQVPLPNLDPNPKSGYIVGSLA